MSAAGNDRDEFIVVRSQVDGRAFLLMHTDPRTLLDQVHDEGHIHRGAAESNASGEHKLLPNSGGQLLFHHLDADLVSVGHPRRRC